MIYIIAILAIGFANYMFFRRDKRKMHEEERRKERFDRLLEMLKKKEGKAND